MGDLEAAVLHLKRWREVATKTLEVDDLPFQSREKELAGLFSSYGNDREEEDEGEFDLR